MLDAAVKALTQLFSRPFRTVLLKAIGLALVLLVALGIGLHRLLAWLLDTGGVWIETTIGPAAHAPVNVFEWLLAIAVGIGIAAGTIFLMPAVTSLVASFFVDEIADIVERTHYPADPPGRAVPIGRAVIEGAKAAALAILVYLIALPFVFVAGLGVIIFFVANAYLLGRIYFELVAMRFHPASEAKRLRKTHQATAFAGGLFIAAFVSIPIVNLATPLFGTAFMVHVHKRLAASRRGLIEPKR